MKSNGVAILLLGVLLVQGCASFMAHEQYMSSSGTNPRAIMITPVFPGTVDDLKGAGLSFVSPITCLYTDDVEWWYFVLSPLFLVDGALSCVLDVIYLPGDLNYWATKPKQ